MLENKEKCKNCNGSGHVLVYNSIVQLCPVCSVKEKELEECSGLINSSEMLVKRGRPRGKFANV